MALNGFLSVVVITCPSHGQGRRFDPGRKHGDKIFCWGYPIALRDALDEDVKVTNVSVCSNMVLNLC